MRIGMQWLAIVSVAAAAWGGERDAGWWNRAWRFRSPVVIKPNEAGSVSEYAADFSQLLDMAGCRGRAFDERSVRVVCAGEEVPCVFNRSYGFDAKACAVGRVRFAVEPARSGEGARRYDVYFDTLGNGPKPARRYAAFAGAAQPDANLFPNPEFAAVKGGQVAGWGRYGAGYAIDRAQGHGAAPSVRCRNTSADEHRGVNCTIELNHRLPCPVLVSGWSKAQDVSGGPDRHYSIYVDVLYADGSKLWAQCAEFGAGTHDWRKSERWILPAKPIRSLTVHALFRKHTGTVWFDDLRLEVTTPESAPPLARVESLEPTAPRKGPVKTLACPGLELALGVGSGGVRTLRVKGRDLTHAASAPLAGFMVKDVGHRADFVSLRGPLLERGGKLVQDCERPTLGLKLHATYEAKDTHIEVSGEIADTTGADRAVTLEYRLPVDAEGWTWAEHVMAEQRLEPGAWRLNTLYPFAAIHDKGAGLGLGIPMDMPCVFRLSYESGPSLLLERLSYDFGLTRATAKFPGRARFRFFLFPFDVTGSRRPGDGFRSALARWYAMFPQWFVKRVRHEGQWLWGAGDLSRRIKDLDDFGFGFDEGPMCPARFDNEHRIHTFANTCQPMQHWVYVGEYDAKPDVAPQQAAELARAAAGGNARRMKVHQILANAGAHDAQGRFMGGTIHNDVWEAFGGTGRRWSMPMWVNGDPELPRPNMAWSKVAMVEQREARAARGGGRIDGAYIDNVFWSRLSNYRRDHFKTSDLPLTFDPRTRQVAQPIGWGMHELVTFVVARLRPKGQMTMGNVVISAHTFMAPLFDVAGQEMGWAGGDKFVNGGMPLLLSLAHRRAFMRQKPIPLLVSGRIHPFPKQAMEHYIKLCMFWGAFPGTDYAAPTKDGKVWAYWREPSAYERDRPLFKRFMPIIRRIARAGWTPVTHAWSETRSLLVERFGRWGEPGLHFTARNEGKADVESAVTIDARALGADAAMRVTELTTGKALSAQTDVPRGLVTVRVSVAAKDTVVLRCE